jgi:hypothetical protein
VESCILVFLFPIHPFPNPSRKNLMRKFISITFIFLALGCVGLSAWGCRLESRPLPKNYEASKARIQTLRDSLAQRYATASAEKQKALLTAGRKSFLKAIDEDFFPAWMGTNWDFNGTTQKPGEGNIACGYFVTTILRDAGVGLERVKLAQQASLKIIQTLCPKAEMKDYGGIDVPELVKRLGTLPKGLYIVGLDIHTGFIFNREEVEFIHASYGTPSEVVREKALKSKVLAQSKRFVLGRVDNDELLRKWLMKTPIPTL